MGKCRKECFRLCRPRRRAFIITILLQASILLVSVRSAKMVLARCIVSNQIVLRSITCIGLLASPSSSSGSHFVCASHHHSPKVSKCPFNGVGVHAGRVDALALLNTVNLNRSDMPQDQCSDAKPSLICKKVVLGSGDADIGRNCVGVAGIAEQLPEADAPSMVPGVGATPGQCTGTSNTDTGDARDDPSVVWASACGGRAAAAATSWQCHRATTFGAADAAGSAPAASGGGTAAPHCRGRGPTSSAICRGTAADAAGLVGGAGSAPTSPSTPARAATAGGCRLLRAVLLCGAGGTLVEGVPATVVDVATATAVPSSPRMARFRLDLEGRLSHFVDLPFGRPIRTGGVSLVEVEDGPAAFASCASRDGFVEDLLSSLNPRGPPAAADGREPEPEPPPWLVAVTNAEVDEAASWPLMLEAEAAAAPSEIAMASMGNWIGSWQRKAAGTSRSRGPRLQVRPLVLGPRDYCTWAWRSE